MGDQPSAVTREDLEAGARKIVDTLANTGEGMVNPVFLKSMGTAAMMGVVYWVGRRKGRKRIKRAISELARMV
ncbi:MAG: hypothetical protein F4Z41_10570 [Acidimicrobiia bacterium]|nr:hypothetical protein [bacterium]MXX46618.1 hypothetical protein [Acidimicrobiia bacterium]MXY73320.1 hypothetical protein [Acidimicrobiia bacterium]MYA38437.1 hypothetical protein [Acidimicrobiia bacterium]MYB78690.1 hypothetical protein [Acidimicrobiia bacterium]